MDRMKRSTGKYAAVGNITDGQEGADVWDMAPPTATTKELATALMEPQLIRK
jgi:hypothetical protein